MTKKERLELISNVRCFYDTYRHAAEKYGEDDERTKRCNHWYSCASYMYFALTGQHYHDLKKL